MDDEEFEDLLGEAETIQGASGVLLTGIATDFSSEHAVTNSTASDHIRLSHSGSAVPELHARQHGSTSFAQVASASLSPAVEQCPPESIIAFNPLCSLASNTLVIAKIEHVFEEIIDALLNEKTEISIALKLRTSRVKSHTRQGDSNTPIRSIRFPGKTAEEAWRFSVVMRIMELMHEALRNDTTISKRDIYYRDPALFGDQKHVDRYVDDIALTFGITRSGLNVVAAAKGLLAGSITFCCREGAIVNAAGEPGGLLIPNIKDILSVDMRAVRWILVIEKEATFRSITASKFWHTASTKGVLLTGKGYPDLASRAMLRFLSEASPQNGFVSPPVFGLADFDPDGAALLDTYKHGSKALDHETASHQVSHLQWLGLRHDDLQPVINDQRADQGVLALTPRDRKKAVTMLQKSVATTLEWPDQLQIELQRMLMLNLKAELQLFDTISGGMAEFLCAHLDSL